MPSFLADGFRLSVFTCDEKGHPPHCHVRYGNARVTIRLDPTFEAYDVAGMKNKDVQRARAVVAIHYRRLRQIWDEKVEGQNGNTQANQENGSRQIS